MIVMVIARISDNDDENFSNDDDNIKEDNDNDDDS